MANYSLVTDATFRPFTFDELVKPYLMYKQEYDKIEKDYTDLAAQAEAFRDMANQEASPEAYAMYSKYSEDLNKATEDLQEGLSPMTRRNLMNLKKRYAGEIAPIAASAAKIKEANDTRIKAGPDAIFRVSKYTGVDAGLHGKELDNTYTSESAITKKAAGMSEAAMAELAQDPEYKKFLNGQAYLITQHTGGSYEDLMDAVNNNEQTQSRLAKIKQDIKKSLGYDKYDAEGQARIEDAINTGLYAGLDKPVRQLKENADHMTPYQSVNLRMAQEEHNAKMQDRQPIYIAPPVYKEEVRTKKDGHTEIVTTDEVDEEATRKNAYWLDPVTGLPFVKKDESKGTEPSNRRYVTDVKSKAGSSSSDGGGSDIHDYERLDRPVKINIEGNSSTVEASGDDVEPEGTPVDYDQLSREEAKQVDKYVGTKDNAAGYSIYRVKSGLLHKHTSIIIIPRKHGTSRDTADDGKNAY